MLQVVASPIIVILTILQVPFMLLENIYSIGITHNDHHLQLSYTGHRSLPIVWDIVRIIKDLLTRQDLISNLFIYI
jgi:hypothetical protein